MVFLVDSSQSFLVNVRIHLSRGDVHMPEHFLNASQVGSTGQQVCGEAVS
jgi:hypothetical protein